MSAWAERALRFNALPAEYAHVSWWPRELVELLQRLRREPDARVVARASACITAERGLAGRAVPDFRPLRWRLWLAPPGALRSLAIETGVAAMRECVRRCVTRESRSRVEQRIGSAAMNFALTPQAAAFARCVRLPAGWDDESVDLAGCAAMGAANLLGSIDGEAHALLQRSRLLFPRLPALEPLEPADRAGLVDAALRRAPELDPTCRSLLS